MNIFYSLLMTSGSDVTAPSLTGDQTNDLLNNLVNKTDSGIVLIAVIIAIVALAALPWLYRMKKDSKAADSTFIEVIQNNSAIMAALKETINVNNTTLENSLHGVEDISQATYHNITSVVTQQINIDRAIARLLNMVNSVENKIGGFEDSIASIQEYQETFNENQNKIIEMIAAGDGNRQEMSSILTTQTTLLEDLNLNLEKISKKVTAVAKKNTTTKKTTKKKSDDG